MATAHNDMRDDAAFLEFKADPTPERLAALLTAVQDRVYNICFQILRRPEDAEDACQEVLIELTRGLVKIDEPRPFKVWLYRVAVHTSLDRKEALARQARLASRAPAPEGPPMNEAERAELMRAIRTLDDRTRCMVLEHYFDKLTLEEIGAREGISSVAVFKRLERARESLRRSLAGIAVAPLLESITPVAAPAGLTAKSILIAGGVVVGTKSAVSAGSVVAALMLVGAASTGGYLAGVSRRAPSPRAEVARTESPTPAKETMAKVGQTVEPPAPAEPAPTPLQKGLREENYGKGKLGPGRNDLTRHDSPVSYGRHWRSILDGLARTETWDEFYKKARKMELENATLEDLIFQRLTRELGLSVATAQDLRRLFDEEREETTRVIVENSGGAANFLRVMEEAGLQHDEWRRQRETIREIRRQEYLKLLTFDQLAIFDEHLRNSAITFEGTYGASVGRHFLIGGVGKAAK